MPMICYQSRKFAQATLDIITKANEIIAEYQADGFDLTLRQLYYQFVARGFIGNTQQNYKRLGSIINDARIAGMIDWHAIEDRTRNLAKNPHWDSPADIMFSIAEQYGFDKWADQKFRVEVWIEKEALAGVISDVCLENDVAYFACRGYVSQSEMWAASQRMRVYEAAGQTPVIIHLGDHDPSGIDMTRDIQDRLAGFDSQVKIKRIALNMDQIDQYGPPPNPAKESDSRFTGYSDLFGDESWELDALDPHTIVDLVRDEIIHHRSDVLWRRANNKQKHERALIRRVAERWDEVANMVDGEGGAR